MTWKVAGREGRHVTHDGASWTADPETQVDMMPHLGAPVNVTPTGPVYTPSGPDDQAGLYLLALQTVPGPLEITGDAPSVNVPQYEAPAGAVF